MNNEKDSGSWRLQRRKFSQLAHEMLQSALEITYSPPNTNGFVVVPVGWVVERTLI